MYYLFDRIHLCPHRSEAAARMIVFYKLRRGEGGCPSNGLNYIYINDLIRIIPGLFCGALAVPSPNRSQLLPNESQRVDPSTGGHSPSAIHRQRI